MDDDTMDVEVITPSIDDLLHSIKSGESLDASTIFNDLMSGKIDDALAQEKVRIAGAVYNGDEQEEEEELDVEAELEEEDAEEVEEEEELELDAETEAEVDAAVEEILADDEPEEVLDIDLGDDEEHEEVEDALGLYSDDEAEADIEDILSDDESEDQD